MRALIQALLCVLFSTHFAVAQVGNLFSGAAGSAGAFTCSTSVFSCPSGFASTGSCGVSFIGGSGQNFAVVGTNNGSTPALSGSQVNLIPTGSTHVGLNLNYQTLVNAQKFCTTYTYIPNGWNMSLVIQNSNNNPANGKDFSAGAGCEGGFFQGFSQAAPPNNLFSLMLDQENSSDAGGTTFHGSSVQYYTTGVFASNAPNPPGQSPCNPDLGGTNFTYAGVSKVLTSPVQLNSPATTVETTTGDTYQVTVTYDGNNLVITMFDVTTGGSCPGVTCFTNTWSGINIPSIVGANTAWVGFAAGTNTASTADLLIKTWSYSTP